VRGGVTDEIGERAEKLNSDVKALFGREGQVSKRTKDCPNLPFFTGDRQEQKGNHMVDIDLTQADPRFRKEIAAEQGAGKITACFTCRTCTASCPVSAVNNKFNPYRIIRMALYGLRKEVLESDFIWLCSSCYACQERCPQGVSITEFMTILKNMAITAGHAPAGIRAQRDLLRGQGRIYAIDEFDNKKRNKIDLPSLPTTCEVVKVLFPEC
jgi:heterodisulfide reductase subunit C